MQVKDIMSGDVLKVRPDDNVIDVGNTMESKGVSAAVVVERDELRGIVSKETFVANMSKFCDRPLESLKVSDLMESDIDAVDAEADLKKAVDCLLTQKSVIDRLPVVLDGSVVGFISKGDFTELYLNDMKRRHKVADLMHYNPETVFDYTPLTEVINEIKNLGVKRIMVLSGEKLVGIISIRDLSLMLFREKKVCKTIDPTSCLTAEDVMTRGPITIGKKADAAQAAKIMVEKRIGGIPVTAGEKLEGIITRTDLLKGYQLTMG